MSTSDPFSSSSQVKRPTSKKLKSRRRIPNIGKLRLNLNRRTTSFDDSIKNDNNNNNNNNNANNKNNALTKRKSWLTTNNKPRTKLNLSALSSNPNPENSIESSNEGADDIFDPSSSSSSALTPQTPATAEKEEFSSFPSSSNNSDTDGSTLSSSTTITPDAFSLPCHVIHSPEDPTPEEIDSHPAFWLSAEVDIHRFTVLVFHKGPSSGSTWSWLRQWNRAYNNFIAPEGGEVLAISSARVKDAVKLKRDLKLQFPLVVDEECVIARERGLKVSYSSRSFGRIKSKFSMSPVDSNNGKNNNMDSSSRRKVSSHMAVSIFSHTGQLIYEWKKESKRGWQTPRCASADTICDQVKNWLQDHPSKYHPTSFGASLSEPFHRVMKNSRTRQFLHNFLKRERNGELLDFINDMNTLDETSENITNIYQKYFSESSAHQLNLPSERTNQVRSAFQNFQNNDSIQDRNAIEELVQILRGVSQEINASLERDAFPRFANSPTFSVAMEYLTRRTSFQVPDHTNCQVSSDLEEKTDVDQVEDQSKRDDESCLSFDQDKQSNSSDENKNYE